MAVSTLPDEGLIPRFAPELFSSIPEVQRKAATELRQVLEEGLRDMSSEAAQEFIKDTVAQVIQIIATGDSARALGGILLVDELLELRTDADIIIIKFANCFRVILEQSSDKSDPVVLGAICKTLGHLARAGGQLTIDMVDFHAKEALDWLQADKGEPRRLAAVLVLKELAESTPVLFNVHVDTFLDHIWVALRDSRQEVRIAGASALRACLRDISKRSAGWKMHCHQKIYQQAKEGFNNRAKKHQSEHVHGCLLALGELLQHAQEFLQGRFYEVCDTVLAFRNHRRDLISDTVIGLIPKLATLHTEAFADKYLSICLNHTITQLRNGHRDVGFRALGELALVVGDEILPQLDTIVSLIQSQMLSKAGKTRSTTAKTSKDLSYSALSCVGMLARALRGSLAPYLDRLVDRMFEAGLSLPLIEALMELTESIPQLLPEIQERLLETVAAVLIPPAAIRWAAAASALPSNYDYGKQAGRGATHLRQHSESGVGTSAGPAGGLYQPLFDTSLLSLPQSRDRAVSKEVLLSTIAQFYGPAVATASSPAFSPRELPDTGGKSGGASASGKKSRQGSVMLALATLGNFDFGTQGARVLCLVSDCVLLYLDSNIPHLRREAAATICKLLPRLATAFGKGHTDYVIYGIVSRLVTFAIAEPLSSCRLGVLSSLGPTLDRFLAQAELIFTLTTALSDEKAEVREEVITLLGRLSQHNPAFVLPALRRTLIQLLDELRQGNTSNQENATSMLGHLITHAPGLIKPYVAPILAVLMQKLDMASAQWGSAVVSGSETSASAPPSPTVRGESDAPVAASSLRTAGSGVTTHVLSNLGTLSTICGEEMKAYLPSLVPLILYTLQDRTFPIKRQVALHTLGQLLRSTGSVVEPCELYPELLPLILHLLNTEPQASMRIECLKVLGIVGALDPHRFKLLQTKAAANTRAQLGKKKLLRGQTGRPAVPMAGNEQGAPTNTAAAAAAPLPGAASESLGPDGAAAVGAGGASERNATAGSDVKGVASGKDGSDAGAAAVAEDGSVVAGGAPAGGRVKHENETAGPEPGMGGELGIGEGPPGSELPLDGVDELGGISSEQTLLLRLPDNYFSTVAIQALMRVLREGSLVQHHRMVIKALMFIFQTLGVDSVSYMQQIVPSFLRQMVNAEEVLRDTYFQQLCGLIVIVRGPMRPYLPSIFRMIAAFWDNPIYLDSILSLVEEISRHLPDDFHHNLPIIIPKLLKLLNSDKSDGRVSVTRGLNALSVMARQGGLGGYLHVLLPPLVHICEAALATALGVMHLHIR
eukprot:g78029.t1